MRLRSRSDSELVRTGRACVLLIVPLLAFYGLVVAVEKGVGFAPAYAAPPSTEPGTSGTRPGTTGPPTTEPTTTFMPPTSTVPITTQTTAPLPTRTDPETTEPTTPDTTRVPITTFPNPTNATRPPGGGGTGTTYMPPDRTDPGGSTNCHEQSPGVNIPYRCGGANWICRYKEVTPGTYCIDP